MSANLSITRPHLWNTQNDLPERVRAEAIVLLNQQLADALDLHLQAKQVHWNVKGPSFIALHELFDEVEEALDARGDRLRRRAGRRRHGGPLHWRVPRRGQAALEGRGA